MSPDALLVEVYVLHRHYTNVLQGERRLKNGRMNAGQDCRLKSRKLLILLKLPHDPRYTHGQYTPNTLCRGANEIKNKLLF